MKKITVYVSTGYVGAKRTATFEIDVNLTESEIEEIAREAMFDMIDWGYYEGEEIKSRW